MSPDAEISITPPAPNAPSAAAERMRLYRERRRKKLRCVTIELRETEIDRLIRRGLLNAEMRGDLIAVRDAMHRFLDQMLN
jgi:hypothetical protein